MGVQIPTGFTQANFRWSVAGDPEFMVCTLGLFDSLGETDPTTIASRVGTAWDACDLTTASEMAAGWSAGTVLVTYQSTTGPVTIEAGTAVGGTGTAGTLPNNCAVLVRKFTSTGGRRGRGRIYLPPAYLLETTVNQVGTIDPAEVSSIQLLVDDLLFQLSQQDFLPRLFHEDGGVPATITQMLVQPKLATQRKRMRR